MTEVVLPIFEKNAASSTSSPRYFWERAKIPSLPHPLCNMLCSFVRCVQMGFLGTNTFMMAFTSYFFEGFVLVRVPFPLTNRFKVYPIMYTRGSVLVQLLYFRVPLTPFLLPRAFRPFVCSESYPVIRPDSRIAAQIVNLKSDLMARASIHTDRDLAHTPGTGTGSVRWRKQMTEVRYLTPVSGG